MSNSDQETEIYKDRRAAPRHQINLQAPVLITAVSQSAFTKEPYLTLQGRIHDISISGLGLIISNKNGRELKRSENEWIMNLLLPLPAGSIELEVIPVRYQQLDNSENSEILVGTHITDMKGRDRILFMELIRECE